MTKKRERSASNAVILKILANKYNISEQYARACSKGFAESDKAIEVLAEYKRLQKELINLSK